jgi:hypothetical protein
VKNPSLRQRKEGRAKPAFDGRWMIEDGDSYQPWKQITGVALKDIQLNGETPVQLEV